MILVRKHCLKVLLLAQNWKLLRGTYYLRGKILTIWLPR